MREPGFPNGARFAFAICDDAEEGFVENLTPVYQLFDKLGIKATKLVWMIPPRDDYRGDSLEDPRFLSFVRDLHQRGHEIGIHGITSGSITRSEILECLEEFEQLLGFPPRLHTNHASNRHNLYWGADRFVEPLRTLYGLVRRKDHSVGHEPNADCFWADAAAERLQYMRHFAFGSLNTARVDARGPYRISSHRAGEHMWFNAADGRTVDEFVWLLAEQRIERAIRDGGFAIVYTHLGCGFTTADGKVNPEFAARLQHLASRNVWFVPVGTLLDFLVERSGGVYTAKYGYLLRLNAIWLLDRCIRWIRFRR